MPGTKRDQILHLIEKTRVLRPQDVEAIGIAVTYPMLLEFPAPQLNA